jgi:hypothetical protein
MPWWTLFLVDAFVSSADTKHATCKGPYICGKIDPCLLQAWCSGVLVSTRQRTLVGADISNQGFFIFVVRLSAAPDLQEVPALSITPRVPARLPTAPSMHHLPGH